MAAFFGCQSVSKNVDDKETTIAVDFSKKVVIDNSVFVDSVSFIKLETSKDALLGTIFKVSIFEDNIVILDNLSVIYIFDLTGKYKYRIDQVGQGPGEYLKADDITINEAQKTIDVLVIQSRKVNHYALADGSFVKETRDAGLFYSLFYVEENQYIIYQPRGFGEGAEEFGFVLVDSLFQIQSKLLEHKGEYPLFAQDNGAFSKVSDQKYGLYSTIDNSIYHFQAGSGIEKKFILNFKGKMTIKSKKGVSMEALSEDEISQLSYVYDYKETDKIIYFYAIENNKSVSLVVYSKEDKKVYVVKELKDNSYPLAKPLKSEIENIMVGAINGWSIKQNMATLNNRKFKINDQLLTLINDSNEEDNPILQILYLKH